MIGKPAQAGAAYDEHLSRLHKIVMSWQAGEITLTAKRTQMAAENDAFYGGPARGETGTDLSETPLVRDEVVLAVAMAQRVPLEAAQEAMAALRGAAWASEHADSLEDARRLLAAGQGEYQNILNAAR
jgi:hypothetical protein